MNRQVSIALKLTLYHSVALLSEHYFIPQKHIFQYRLFLALNLGYMLLGLATEYYLQHSNWVKKINEKKENVDFEVLDYAIMGAAYSKSMVHALLSATGAIYIYVTPSEMHQDYMYGYSYFAELLLIHSIAYFVGDILDMLRYIKPFTNADWVFVWHHVGGIIAFGFPLVSELGYYIAACALLFEISTPFLNARWWLYQLQMKETTLFIIFEFLFVATFVAVRTIWGMFVYTRRVLAHLLPLMMGQVVKSTHYRTGKDQTAFIVSFIAFGLLIAFNCLNLFFLHGIVRMLLRRFQKKNQ
jgi:hypothetical protein